MPSAADYGLPRIPRRVPKPVEKELFPEKQCFCCDNRGIVAHRWILMLTPDYQEGDIPQACQRPGCKGIWTGDGFQTFGDSVRFGIAWDVSAELCDYLHNLGHCQWQEDKEAWNRQLKENPNLEQENYLNLKKLTEVIGGGQPVKSEEERALEEVGL